MFENAQIQKKTGWIYIFFYFNKVRTLYLLICQNWVLNTVLIFVWNCHQTKKRGQRIFPAFVRHPENGCIDLEIACKKPGLRECTDLFSLVSSNRMHVNGLKLFLVRFRLGVRMVWRFSSLRRWSNTGTGFLVNALSLPVFRRHLG